MKKICFLLAVVGAAAAQTPDYPVIYSPEAGGPVANPAYNSRPASYAQQQPVAAYQPRAYSAQGSAKELMMPPMRYTVDMLIGYGFKAVPNSKYATDVVTCELEGAYNLTPRQAITLSVGLAGGGETNDYWVHEERPHRDYPFTDSYDRLSFTVMAGYRFTQPLTRGVSLQAGAKCGLDVQTLDVDYGYGWSGYPYNYRDGKSDTQAGMAYAGYVNLLFHVARNADFVVGYQFRGSTAKPSPSTGEPEPQRFHTSTMRWHEIHIGAAFRF